MENGFNINQAEEEAGRCLLCYDAPCSKNCPAGTDPAKFIRQLRMRNLTGAVRTIKTNNILGGACGVLCPSERLCERECVAKGLAKPIEIKKIQRALVEYAWESNCFRIEAQNPNGKSVAVVGAGPAGLSASSELARIGFRVTVFEEKKEAGGVLRFGVPDERFPKSYLEREIGEIKKLGVKFKFNSPIKTKAAFEKLRKSFDAVFVSTGLWQSVNLLNGKGIKGVFSSIEFLEGLKDGKNPTRIIKGKRVAVVGGGSVAIDCAKSAMNHGARDVYLVYRRSYKEMPAEEDEKISAQNSGVQFLLLNQPIDVVVKKGVVTGIKLTRTELGNRDKSGRRRPVRVKNSEWILDADVVIEAVGDRLQDAILKNYPIKFSDKGMIVVNEKTGKASVQNVFAGGDAVLGPGLVVNAVADGKKAAGSMARECGWPSDPKSAEKNMRDVSVTFCGKKFRNPFMLSSSPVSNCADMIEKAFELGWAGVSFKTIASDSAGIIHPSPRMYPYRCGNERLVGLQNVEQISDRKLSENLRDLQRLKKKFPDRVLMASIMGFSTDEWCMLAKACEDSGADMLELNFSCPHLSIEGGGYKVGQEDGLVEKFTAAVKHSCKIPVVAKMTPNITDINGPAMSAKKGGADAISAINTIRSISEIGLDDYVSRPNVFGKGAISGYSGPAVKPIALRFIAEMAQNKALALPLSAMGGIETWVDALEFLLVGATTLQVTTGIIHYGYQIVEDLVEGLSDYMAVKNIARVSELIGRALPNLTETSEFDLKRQGRADYDLERCIGCGQCYVVCADAGGSALGWDVLKRRPVLDKNKCLSCMICKAVCPVSGMIGYKEKT